MLGALFHSFRTGERMNHEGTDYRLTRLQPYFNPGPDESVAAPPIWLGGVNPLICRLAGERAAGFVTHPTNSNPRYLETTCIPNLLVGLEAAGRERRDLELVVGLQMITGATTTEIDAERERQRRLFAFLYSTPAYQRTLELYGWDDLGPRLRALIRADRWDDLDAVVTDEILDTLVPAASYDQVADRVRERVGGLADGVLLAPPPDPAHDHLVAEAIAALHAA